MKNEPLIVVDRKTKRRKVEKIYGKAVLSFLYKGNPLSSALLTLIAKTPLLSSFYGVLQNTSFSKKKIIPFIKEFEVDATEFEKKINEFRSFNDFFTRKLRASTRPLAEGEEVAIIPADGRFLCYESLAHLETFFVKGRFFSLEKLLQDKALASHFSKGSMLIGRLAPPDYHRFHFPCAARPFAPRPLNGPLFSVNPLALRSNLSILTENKRTLTELKTDCFGTILFIEIGATCVGAIHQSFTPHKYYQKGCEKGFFSFGGSSIILLFERGKITFDDDLIQTSKKGLEMRCLMGQSLGKVPK